MSAPLRALSLAMLGLYLAFASLLVNHTRNGLDPAGAPLGYDFSAYYEAGRFALKGEAARAYDDATMIAAEQSRFPGSTTKLPWNYPPLFQLLLLPFAALPYLGGFALWTGLMLAGHLLLMRAVAAPPALWLMLLFPGAVINLFLGANGLLVALLIGGGLVLVERRPLLAGVLFGLAAFKPHLVLLVPLALLAGGRYRALLSMACTVALLVAGSALAFGTEAWLAFLAKATQAAGIAAASSSDWASVPTLYTLAQVLGAGKPGAAIVHGIAALAAAGAVAWIWRRADDNAARMSALCLGLLIVTPYARIYDLALLALPILILATKSEARMALPAKAALACAWIAPLIGLAAGALIPWLSLLMLGLLTLTILSAIQKTHAPQPF